jgi:PAP2 superfamily.
MLIRILLLLATLSSMLALPSLARVRQWDEAVMSLVARQRGPAWTSFFLFITNIGATPGFLVVLLAGTLFFLLRRRYRQGIFFLVGLGLLKLMEIPLKILIARLRPSGGLLHLETFSMPSGHAINGVLIFGVLGIFLMKIFSRSWWRGIGFAFCITLAFAVGFSRVYLGVHFPSDVLMGMLYAAAGLWFLQGIKKDMWGL